MLNGVSCSKQDGLWRKPAQRLQPQSFNLVKLAIVGIGGVKLVVIIEPKQREYLIERFDELITQRFRNWLAVVSGCALLPASLPSWCR